MQTAARGVISSSKASTSAASPYPCSKKVFVEISNALHRSNVRWRGRSFVASVLSDSSKPSKGQKRLPKHKRRAMVESFVDKYRASNAGKFPTASLARQQVGGSYYVIREIIQELEYESKFPPINKTKEVHMEKVEEVICLYSDAKEEPSFTEVEEISSSATPTSCTSHKQFSVLEVSSNMGVIKTMKMDETLSVNTNEAEESASVSAHVEKTMAEEAVNPVMITTMKNSGKQVLEGVENSSTHGQTCVDSLMEMEVHSKDSCSRIADKSSQDNDWDSSGGGDLSASNGGAAASSLKGSVVEDLAADTTGSVGTHSDRVKSEITVDILKSFPGELDGTREDASTSNPVQYAYGPKGVEQKGSQEAPKSEDLHGDITRKLEHEEPLPTRSTVWENLKSLAEGIINFWKKM